MDQASESREQANFTGQLPMNHFNESPYKTADAVFHFFLKQKNRKAELRKLLRLELVGEVIKQAGLRLFGRAERKDDND